MVEYVLKEDILKYLEKKSSIEISTNSVIGKDISRAIDVLYYDIGNMPAEDVQAVKRGRWIETHILLCKWIPENEKEEGHNFYMAELKCSCCKRYNTVTFALSLTKPDFCQLCGARMDGEQDD